MVMVVYLGKTKRSVLSQALGGIKLFSVPVLGLIANGSREQSSLNDPYHQYSSIELERPFGTENALPPVVKQPDQ
jgi:polysaccharide biosynthesis transport protein